MLVVRYGHDGEVRKEKVGRIEKVEIKLSGNIVRGDL